MIRFLLKRYVLAMRRRRIWLGAALVPVLLYGGIAALNPDFYKINQDIAIAQDAPVARTGSPVGYVTMSSIVAQPKAFLLDNFAVKRLAQQLPFRGGAGSALEQERLLRDIVSTTVSITHGARGNVRVTYNGTDEATGKKLVAFYAARLVQQGREGLQRSSADRGTQSTVLSTGAVNLIGSMNVQQHMALWRTGRAVPAAIIFCASIIIVLMIIGFLEWIDPSFKSERQVVRYLGLPTLGALPDLDIICSSFGIKETS
ncbi:MAG: hypothetical protein GY868_02475 [Deltaproteobacteria bacterium]|nr:hypothetical protein [Deltaproteobacteria bacterium]